MEGDTFLVSDIERLAVPKRRQYNFENVEEHMAGLPPDPLPTWTTLPLDHKLPMIPGPKGAVSLFTTNLGEKIHKRSHEWDFDLTDPYAMELSNDYKVLHDPHLKLHLTNPQMKRRLYRGGFITKDGKVLCTLKEFNEYRHYLRKINLLMEKRRERENKMLNAVSQIQQTKKESEAMRLRELKIKEIKERLSKQYEEDRARYVQLLKEKEERRRKIRQDQIARLSEKEQKIHEKEERRQLVLQRRNIEERRRKLEKLRKWMFEDEERYARAQMRRQKQEDDQQKKLEDSWEDRKRFQQQRLQQEIDRQKTAEEIKNKRISEREAEISEHRKQQQEMYLNIIEKQKKEKQLLEEAYADNLSKRLERKRALSALKRKRKRKGKGRRSRLQSNWDIEKTLMNIVSLDDLTGADGRKLDTVKEEKELKSSTNALGPRALVSPEDVAVSVDRLQVQSNVSSERIQESVSPRTSALDMYHVMKSSKGMTEEGMDVLSEEEEEDKEEEEPMEDVEKAASAIVDMSMYLTTKVIYPAYMRWLKEDHPDEYERHLQKSTSTELSDDKPEVDSETSDMVLKSKDKKRGGGVQFSTAAEVVPSSELAYMQSHYSADERPITRDIGSDEEDEEITYNRKLSLSYKDSVTRLLSRGSMDMVDNQEAQELEQILRMILEELSSGKLKGSQVAELICIARNILDSLQILECQDEQSTGALTPEMMSNPSSQFSLLAGEIVQQTLSKVKKDLLLDEEFLEKYQSQAYESGAPVESVSSMAQFIVNKVITSAVHSLQAVSEETTRLGSSGGPRPSSAPATPDRPRRDLPDLVQEEAPIQVRSETSDLVWAVLQRTAKEVEAEIMKANPTKQVSEMSQFVRHVISQAAQELVANATDSFINWNKTTTMQPLDSKTSDISYFVQHTISKVLKDMEKEGLIPRSDDKVEQTASSVFVEHLVELTLQQCLGEVKEQMIPKGEIINMAAAIIESYQGTRSDSALGRTSPSRTRSLDVVAGVRPKGPSGASSLLVETFIKETLSKVLEDLNVGNMTAQEISTLAQAFGRSYEAKSDSSIDACTFVQTALENVLKDFNYEEYNSIDVVKAQELFGLPSSKESNEAAELLSKAFAEVIEEISDSMVPVKSKSSQEIELFIKAVLKKTNADICHPTEGRTTTPAPLIPMSASSQELEDFIHDIINQNAADLAEEFGLEYKQIQARRLKSEECVGSRDIFKRLSSKDTFSKSSAAKKSSISSKSKVSQEVQSKLSAELSNYIQDIIAENKDHLSRQSIRIPSFAYPHVSSKSSEDLNASIKEIITSAAKDVAENVEIDNTDTYDSLVITHIEDHSTISGSASTNTSATTIVVHEGDEASSDDGLVEPVLGHTPLSLDHTVIENALSVFSVKKDHDLHHIHEFEAVPRNSFMSLQHPNVAMVKRLSHDNSDKELCTKIKNLSSKCMETLSHPDEDVIDSSGSSSDSGDSLEIEMPLDSINVISVQDLHTSVKGPDENPAVEPSKVATSSSRPSQVVSLSSQKSGTSTKQKTSSPYHSRVSTPNIQSTSNAKTTSNTSSGVNRNTPSTSKTPVAPKQSKPGSHTGMKIRNQTTPVNSRTTNKSGTGQSVPKIPGPSVRDSKGTGSFPKMQTKKSSEVNRSRSENPKVKSESSVKQTKSSSLKIRSKTQQAELPAKVSVQSRKSKPTTDVSAKSLHTKSRTSSNKLKTSSSSDTTSKVQMTKSSSKKDVVGTQPVDASSKENDDNIKSPDKMAAKEEQNLNEEKNPTSELKLNEGPHIGEIDAGLIEVDSQVNKPDDAGVLKDGDIEQNVSTKELIEMQDETDKAAENPVDNNENNAKKKNNVKTGQTPQSQSIEIKSKISGSLSINLVEEDALSVRQTSDVSLKSAPADVVPVETTNEDKKEVTEDIMEEIEEDIQTVRRISARKSARSSTTGELYGYVPTMHSSYDFLAKPSSQVKTVEMISSSFPQLQNKKSNSSKGSQGSVGSSKSNRGSHRTVNLTPRPSSGYSKSPTPQIFNQLSGPLPNTTSENDNDSPVRQISGPLTSSRNSSVTSRLMKSISNLGDKIFGRKTPSATNVEEKNIKSPSGQLLTRKKSKGSLIVLSKEELRDSDEQSPTRQDDDKTKSHSSKTTIMSELSKMNSVVTLSPKQSKSSLRDLSKNVNNSSGVNVQGSVVNTSQTYYTHSDNEEEEPPKEESSGHLHNRAGHGHNYQYHQHTKDCPSTGSLPELESQSHSIMKTSQGSAGSVVGKSKSSWTSPKQPADDKYN